jgi:hypothetical protein
MEQKSLKSGPESWCHKAVRKSGGRETRSVTSPPDARTANRINASLIIASTADRNVDRSAYLIRPSPACHEQSACGPMGIVQTQRGMACMALAASSKNVAESGAAPVATALLGVACRTWRHASRCYSTTTCTSDPFRRSCTTLPLSSVGLAVEGPSQTT